MTRIACLLCLAGALGFAAPASADQILPPGRITGNTGSGDILFGALKMGKRQDGKTVLQPDSLEIQAPGSIGDVSGMSVLGRPLQVRARDVINVKDAPYNAKCDGSSDDAAAINAALTAAAPATGGGGSVFVPNGTCRLGANAFIPSGVDFWTNPGAATLKPTPGRTGSVVLVRSSNTSGASLRGFNLDGDIASIGDSSTVVQMFNTKYFVIDGVNLYDTRGLGILFSNASYSGVRNSRFYNTGTYFLTTGDKTDRKAAITFTGDATSRPNNVNNYAINNRFDRSGLDQVSVGWQTGTIVSGNAMGPFVPEWPTYSWNDYPGHVYVVDTNNTVVSNNTMTDAPGNGVDVTRSNGVTISNNDIVGSGQAPIAISNSQNGTVSGNRTANSGGALVYQAGLVQRGGIFLGPNPVSNFTFTGNRSTDTQAVKTQPYGFASASGVTHPNIWVDRSNDFSGNAISDFGLGWSGIRYTSSRTETRSLVRPDYRSGAWYTARGAGRAGTPVAQTTDTLYVYPFVIDSTVTIQNLAMRIGTGVAGTSARLGIYAASGTLVKTLVAQGNTEVSGATAATVSAPLASPVTLEAGVYWFAALVSGPMQALTVSNSAHDVSAIIGSSSATNVLTGDVVASSASTPYANGLPADASSLNFSGLTTSAAPRLAFQVQ